MKINLLILILIPGALTLGGCQMAMQQSGIGVTNDAEVIKATAYQFGVEDMNVTLDGDIQRKPLPSGQELLYNVKISNRPYRCFMKTKLIGHDKPICAKKGEPLNIPQESQR